MRFALSLGCFALAACTHSPDEPLDKRPDASAQPDATGLPLIAGICDSADSDVIALPTVAKTPPCQADSSGPLFADIGLLGGDYAALHAICNQMNAAPDTRDDLANAQLATDMHAFFVSLLDREPVQRALKNVTGDADTRANTLASVWLGRNAFEHVMCGERAFDGTVGGLHMWSEYYAAEREGRTDYLCTVEGANDPAIATVSFRWQPENETTTAYKPVGGFAVGPSPACILALGYAALEGGGATRPGTDVLASFRGEVYGVTRDWLLAASGRQIVTMYPRAAQ